MKKEMIILAIAFILFTSLVSGKLTISAPEDIYNLGNKLYVTVDVFPSSVSGNFQIDIICNNETMNIYKIPAGPSFHAGEQQKVTTFVTLDKSSLGNLKGKCYLSASLGNEQTSTKSFSISDKIVLTAKLDKLNYNPGETITLTLEAVKANNQLLNGFVDAVNATSFSKAIQKGNLIKKFAMPETAEAGEYSILIYAYDRGSNNEILNTANTSISFSINQIPSFIQLSFSELKINPGSNLTIGGDIYDQSGKLMQGEIILNLISPNKEEFQKTVKSEKFAFFDFPENASAGEWKVLASFSGILQEETIKINELAKVDYEFIGSVLVVKNTGNVIYNKPINIKIGERNQEINLNMQPGEERKFNLNAPNGEYNVAVGDANSKIEKNIPLTGRAISVKDLDAGSLIKDYAFIWVFIVIILVAIAVVLFFKFKRKTIKLNDKTTFSQKLTSNYSNTLHLTKKSPLSQSLDEKNYEEYNHGLKDLTKPDIGKAESSLVLKGEKSPSAVMSISIFNLNELKENSKNEIQKINEIIKDNKGLVDIREDRIIAVFSPLVTKTFKNEIIAVKAAAEILKELRSFNKKFTDKIKFNIGIHSGDLIASKEQGKLKYTGIGNTIALTRRISDSNENNLLISEQVKIKLMRAVKVEKVGEIGKSSIYSVQKIQDMSANQEKLQDLLKRMDND